MDWWEWLIASGVVAFAGWMTRMYLAETTKKTKAGDQLISLCELNKRCKNQKKEILKEIGDDMIHVKELIEKDLERARERFEELGAIQKETTKALAKLTIEIKLLQQTRTGTARRT